MPFTDKQQEFFNNANHRWNFKTGATRSGKTYGDFFWVPKRIRNRIGKDGASVILGVSKSTIERNILEPMRNLWGKDLVRTISTDNTCYLFGERVHCLGAEKISQVAKIRGMSIKYCYGDEVAEWNKEVFELLKSRLDKEYSCFDGTLNPEGPNHWLKEFLDSDVDMYNQHYTIFDNPYLPLEFVEQLCKEYEGTVYYERYILGNWALAEGLIYPMYESCFAEATGNTPEEYCLSLDYGTQNAFAGILWGKFWDTWYGLKEYYYSGRETGVQKTDQEYFDDLCEFAGTLTNLETIIDPSAASFITLLKRKGKGKFRPRKANNAVEDGIRETATALKSGRIKISSKMKNWKKEAGGYIWDPKSHDDSPLKENDHLMDATRYFVKTKRISEEKTIYRSIFERKYA
jgi:PBSX family phage terminase large subunit